MFGNLSSGVMPEVFFGAIALSLSHRWAKSAHAFHCLVNAQL
ncbi:hypothetical protein [Leptolyngbya sp. FACHB-541]|nr:hypothetical protein [Leptolyngbya sp. FACHB-541]